MARHPIRIGGDREPALDLVSYGRRGPGRPEWFTSEQVSQISRTVRRAPEVMVKVSGGGNSLGAVAAHFRYITRKGALELETDDGERLTGNGVGRNVVEDWDLEIDLAIDRWDRIAGGRRASTAKLVHNIVLSMPAGTSPQKLLASSRDSPARSSHYSTGMPWFCTPTRIIPMCIWWSAPTSAKAAG